MRFGLFTVGLLILGFAIAPAQDNDSPKPLDEPKLEVKKEASTDEEILKEAGFKTDGPSLLEFFRKRTLADAERARVAKLIKQLGDSSYRARELAGKDLTRRGPVVLEMLREAVRSDSLEVSRRAQACMKRIQEKDVAIDVPMAAMRLIGKERPEGALETLFAYLPFADNEYIADEARAILARLAVVEDRASPTLVAGLVDKLPVRRAAAGEVLAKAGVREELPRVRKLLKDPDAFVRLRVSIALALARERDAVPVLIDSIPELSSNDAWLAEDFLFRLAEGKDPPSVSPGGDAETRALCRDAWRGWWKKHGEKVDLAKLEEPARLLGYTLIVLLDLGKVMELAGDNSIRWQVENLVFPLDVQLIGDDRFLVAEYHAHRVTERNLKGDILWEKRVTGPLAAQRLPNGNTFIVTDTSLTEVDADQNEVLSLRFENGEKVMKGMKLPNNEIAILTSDARVVRLSPKGKELNAFAVSMGARLFGGRIHMLSSGRVLIPQNSENKVVEYDSRGKAIWEVAVEQPVAAMRLPNGNTLVTTMIPGRGAVEFDRAGTEVWSYRTFTRVTRALRR